MTREKEISYGDVSVAIRPLEGDLAGGELSVSRVEIENTGVDRVVNGEGSKEIDLGGQIPWDNVVEAIAAQHIAEDQIRPDLETNDWEFVLDKNTDQYAVLVAVVNSAPYTTSAEVGERVDLGYSPSSAITKLADKGMVRYLGSNGSNYYRVAPTPLGVKEVVERGDIIDEDDAVAPPAEDFEDSFSLGAKEEEEAAE